MTLNEFINNLTPDMANFACECLNKCPHHQENDCGNPAKHKVIGEYSEGNFVFLCEECVENLSW